MAVFFYIRVFWVYTPLLITLCNVSEEGFGVTELVPVDKKAV